MPFATAGERGRCGGALGGRQLPPLQGDRQVRLPAVSVQQVDPAAPNLCLSAPKRKPFIVWAGLYF